MAIALVNTAELPAELHLVVGIEMELTEDEHAVPREGVDKRIRQRVVGAQVVEGDADDLSADRVREAPDGNHSHRVRVVWRCEAGAVEDDGEAGVGTDHEQQLQERALVEVGGEDRPCRLADGVVVEQFVDCADERGVERGPTVRGGPFECVDLGVGDPRAAGEPNVLGPEVGRVGADYNRQDQQLARARLEHPVVEQCAVVTKPSAGERWMLSEQSEYWRKGWRIGPISNKTTAHGNASRSVLRDSASMSARARGAMRSGVVVTGPVPR